MAGDWIKMRVGLTTNPRVMRIAECLVENARYLEWAGLTFGVPNYPPAPEYNARAERHSALRVTRYVTVTALLRFWGYANEHVKGEFIAGIFPEDVDEIVGVPGFAECIEAAGWGEFDPDGGLSLPNFGEHNTSAGERSSGAERQKRYRERAKDGDGKSDVTRNVTRDVTVTHREEKKREEKKEEKSATPRAKKSDQTLGDWALSLPDGEELISDDDTIYDWAAKQGIPRPWVGMAWFAFESRYGDNGKRYADWRAVFRKALREDWLKLWRSDQRGGWVLTTAGEMAQREMQA